MNFLENDEQIHTLLILSYNFRTFIRYLTLKVGKIYIILYILYYNSNMLILDISLLDIL